MIEKPKYGLIVVGVAILVLILGAAAGLGLATFLAELYFLPTLNAASRAKRNTTAIFFLNLLLGWTIIGWIVAAIWSATSDAPVAQAPPASDAPVPALPASAGKETKMTEDNRLVGKIVLGLFLLAVVATVIHYASRPLVPESTGGAAQAPAPAQNPEIDRAVVGQLSVYRSLRDPASYQPESTLLMGRFATPTERKTALVE